MPITPTVALTIAVTLAAWSAPQPQHTAGYVGWYGDWHVVQANADFRGYTLDGYACGGSLMSPSDLGKTFWVRLPSGDWRGPCLSVDCSQRLHFAANVLGRHEVAEVDTSTMAALGQPYRAWTDVWIGTCPAGMYSVPQLYRPPVEYDWSDPLATVSYSGEFWPVARQGSYCPNAPEGVKTVIGSTLLAKRR
jgi:hypothetical protein